jgi:hypothetical protein
MDTDLGNAICVDKDCRVAAQRRERLGEAGFR